MKLFTIIMLAWLALSGESYACSCANPSSTTAKQLVRGTPILFWGRAVSFEDQNGDDRVYTVETWGGNSIMPQTVRVMTRTQSAMCGVELPLNKAVLIGGVAKDGYVHTNLCLHYHIQHYDPAITKVLRTCRAFARCPDE